MIRLFTLPWQSVPVVFIDTETTGVRPWGRDRAVQVGLVRFEGGIVVGEFSALVNPGAQIPAEASAIHGITDESVVSAPTIAEVFASAEVAKLLDGTQPAAYNASFDRAMVPPFGEDASWPWLDSLSLVRVVDRYERGKGRHRLEVAASRHGVALVNAHDALSDARAAGELFYGLGPRQYGPKLTLGDVLRMQRLAEVEDWFRFNSWLAQQPPRESEVGP